MDENKTLILMTTFASIDESYSLANVVVDQARAGILAGFKRIQIWTLEHFKDSTLPDDLKESPRVLVKKIFPSWHWQSDTIDDEKCYDIATRIKENLPTKGKGVIITHDLLFQEWFTTFAKALHHVDVREGWTFYHMAHSAPHKDQITEGAAKYRSSCPREHRILCLSQSQRAGFAHHYGTDLENVIYMPNAKDITYFYGFDDWTRLFVYDYGLLDKQVVQIYPLSMTRASDKGLPVAMHIFGEMEHRGIDASLVVVNAHATDQRSHDYKKQLLDYMDSEGITNTIFMDDYLPLAKKYKGITNRQVANLMLVSNLFIFPTKSEACPLVLMEAALAGCLLVLNTDVPSLGDVVPHGETLYYPFGTLDAMPESIPFAAITHDIIKSLDSSAANKAKRHVLRHFNLQSIAKFLQTL